MLRTELVIAKAIYLKNQIVYHKSGSTVNGQSPEHM